MRSGRNLILVGGLLISIVIIGGVIAVGFLFPPQSVGQNFLIQLFKPNENAAYDYLSVPFQTIVRVECPRGAVTGCAEQIIPEAWGKLEAVSFVEARDGSELFHLQWTDFDSVVAVVLNIAQLDEGLRVTGWRGFIVTDEQTDEALLTGARTDNQLAAS